MISASPGSWLANHCITARDGECLSRFWRVRECAFSFAFACGRLRPTSFAD
jgi:hypothetical protein